jgi:hypothetical protein
MRVVLSLNASGTERPLRYDADLQQQCIQALHAATVELSLPMPNTRAVMQCGEGNAAHSGGHFFSICRCGAFTTISVPYELPHRGWPGVGGMARQQLAVPPIRTRETRRLRRKFVIKDILVEHRLHDRLLAACGSQSEASLALGSVLHRHACGVYGPVSKNVCEKPVYPGFKR